MKESVVNWANDWGRKMGIYGIKTNKISAGQHDDLDAFRHAFCHAFVKGWLYFTPIAKDVSDWIGLIMEVPGLFSAGSTTPCASAMDYHNNKVGQDLAPSWQDMQGVLQSAEDPTPYIAKRIADAVRRGDTINSFDDPRMPIHCHAKTKVPGGQYIWRTQQDDKVRWDHAVRNGKIFLMKEPPTDGHPGTAHNCRCYAEPIKK